MNGLILADLRHFLLLASELHFGRTAEQIGVAQPVLSRRIRRLEGSVGVRLLDRTSRTVALTSAGQRLRDAAGAALQTLDRAVGAIRQATPEPTETLRIGFFAAAEPMLPATIELLRAKLGCSIELFHLHSAQQVRQLREGLLDLGFLRPPSSRGDLNISVLLHERAVCVVRTGHRLASLSSLRLRQLEGERLVRFKPMIGTGFQRRIEVELRQRNVAVTFGQSVENTHSVQSLVAMAGGIALLPAYVADNPRPGLCYVAVDDLPAFIPLAVVCKSSEVRPMVTKAFELILTSFKEQSPEQARLSSRTQTRPSVVRARRLGGGGRRESPKLGVK